MCSVHLPRVGLNIQKYIFWHTNEIFLRGKECYAFIGWLFIVANDLQPVHTMFYHLKHNIFPRMKHLRCMCVKQHFINILLKHVFPFVSFIKYQFQHFHFYLGQEIFFLLIFFLLTVYLRLTFFFFRKKGGVHLAI